MRLKCVLGFILIMMLTTGFSLTNTNHNEIALFSHTQRSIMLIIDYSGSMRRGAMNKKIYRRDGLPKYELMSQAILQVLRKLPTHSSIGWMAFGHRNHGDCKDIELLQQPSMLDSDKFQHDIANLTPKGMSPLGAILAEAYKHLQFEQYHSAIVLIVDGRDNCNYQLCESLSHGENIFHTIPVYIVGFDVNASKDKEQLQCIAKATHGELWLVDHASDMNTSLAKAMNMALSPATHMDSGF